MRYNRARSSTGQEKLSGVDGSVWKEGVSLGITSETSVSFFRFNHSTTGSTDADEVSAQ